MSRGVERILDEIALLSLDEQEELKQLLPDVLPGTTLTSEATMEAFEQAVVNRARVRDRLLAEGELVWSVDDDINAMRNERLLELMPPLRSPRQTP